MHSHHTRTMMEKGEDATATAPAPLAHVDPDRIVGLGTKVEDLDPSATDDASVSGRIALARDTSVRVAKDVSQSVSKTVGDTVKTIDERYHVAEKATATRTAIEGTVTSVTTKTTEAGQSATAKLQPKIEGTRQSLMEAAKGVGASVRSLDDKLRVSATVSKVVTRGAAGGAASGTGAGKDAADASDGNNSAADATNPMAILRAEGTVAKTLTVSDQHVTILLTHTVPADGDKGNGGDALSINYREEDAWSAAADDDKKDGATVEEKAAQVLPKTVKSLLKLTVVPFHRQVFDSTMPNAARSDSAAAAVEYSSFSALNESDERNSREILAFLADNYNFDLTSFSGAEYSYWAARPGGRFRFIGGIAKPIGDLIGKLGKKKGGAADTTDDAASAAPSESSSKQNVVRTKAGSFTVEFISPASDRQIQRASPSPRTVLVEETAELYDAVVKPHIQAIVAGGSLSWVKNIVDGTKEAERLILDTDDYIVNIDTKWRSHPDPNTTPREEWLHHSSTADLYCLGIFKADGVACMRDLKVEHVPTLKSMVDEGIAAIERTYGVPRDQIRCYCHYLPQFMHFHVHYTRLENEIGCQVERGHLVSDIIQNLEMDPDYYSKRTITYKLRVTDELYRKIDDYQQQQQGGAESDAGL
mmetsp:Transcript_11257/g.31822  ORF Transcript_11257/g.31822 Transcript_11257/m.31822 type:complete len:646 (+) Transcript_11257:59-1996(+)